MYTQLLFILATVVFAKNEPYYLVKLPQDDGSKCLDGSPASISIQKGSPKKFMFLFQGGGWVQDFSKDQILENSYDRIGDGNRGSSNSISTYYKGSNLMSGSKNSNPYFYDYTKIYLNYCDGTGFSSSRQSSIKHKGKTIWFRGKENALASFNYAIKELKMSEADKVIIGGFSAGAQSSLNWINYFGDKLKQLNPNIQVYGYSDAGVFLDIVDIFKKEHIFQQKQKQLMKLAFTDTDPMTTQCIKDYEDSKEKCLNGTYLIDYLKYPTLFVQSQYDYSVIENILGSHCAKNDIGRCPDKHMDNIFKLSQKLREFYEIKVKNQQVKHGVWSPACPTHTIGRSGKFSSEIWTIPEKSGYTLVEATNDFFNLDKQVWRYDTMKWPHGNKECAFDYTGTEDMYDQISDKSLLFLIVAIVSLLVLGILLYYQNFKIHKILLQKYQLLNQQQNQMKQK